MNTDQLAQLIEKAKEAINEVKSSHELNEVKALYLGKKSPLQAIMRTMKDLSIDEKKELGQKVNECRDEINKLVDEKREALEAAKIMEKLNSEKIDVTLPGKKVARGSFHPLTQIIQEVESIFKGMGYTVEEGPEVELHVFNFEMLNVPKGHPARDMQDTFYINDTILLRTQTSPVQVRTLLESKEKPIKILCPGKVYRRDDDDATHSHQFMQFEGLVVDKHITMSDLKGTLKIFVKKMFGKDFQIRFRPSFFPFTEPSVEVDVSCFKCQGKGCPMCKQTGWIEILGAGMVHPNVLKASGYDPKLYRGFAFGIGIERVAMLRYGIDDIRHLYTNDIRFLQQFE